MSTTDDHNAELLPVGLVGTAAELPALLELALATEQLAVRGQAGLPRAAARDDVPWFDDPRVLMTHGEIAALLVAGPPTAANAATLAALELGLPVWRAAPAGRSFTETLELLMAARDASGHLHTASWWQYVSSAALEAAECCPLDEIIFSDALAVGPGPAARSWRNAAGQAGGGALLQVGWHALEALIATRGLPDHVYAGLTLRTAESLDTPRDVEDAAALTLLLPDGVAAALRVRWSAQPPAVALLHFGSQGALCYRTTAPPDLPPERAWSEALGAPLGGAMVDARDPTGKTLESFDPGGAFLASDLRRFVREIRSESGPAATQAVLERQLCVAAVVECAYLSARTRQPEDPRRIFEVHKWPLPEL